MLIKTIEDLDQALCRLGELNATEAAITAELDNELAQVRERFADEFYLPTGPDESRLLSELRAEAQAAIKQYCEEHRDELLTGKVKSVQLTHGTIGWHDGKASIVELPLDEKAKAKGVLAKCLQAVASVVESLTHKIGKLPILDALRVKVEWDKVAIMKAVNANQISPAALKKAGLSLKEAGESFFAEPKTEAKTGG
jgi:phage host-nuclease inhibitor protein Gam